MTLPPIRREVLVDATARVAYDLFTAQIGAWWPLETHGVFGAGATVAFEDGRIVERGPDGASACWGEVLSWEPPSRCSFTWHPGDSGPSMVTVSFEPREEQTLVVLEHEGWETYADPAVARTEYGHGWPIVLARYVALVAESADGPADGATWVALLHRPGPAASKEGSVVGQSLFAEHFAFLERMRALGYLVAAGPLTDRPDEGMAVLRLPGADRLDEATRLATEDDVSVVKGFFEVTVRPWQVVLTSV